MSQLTDLLHLCTVKITIPGQLGWGTGFFVAPGLILTCAHVVRKAVDGQVTVTYPAWPQPLSAIVQSIADDGKTLDLALVALSEPLLDHPCVLLDEEPVAIGEALYSYGYLESYTNAAPVRPVNEGLTGDKPPLLKLQGAQIEKGISGAALLNLRAGKVCGMVKETRAAGFDLGGGAIPTRVILEQFPQLRQLQWEFHQQDRCWVNLITTQPEIDFRPYLQAILDNDDYREWQEVYTPTTVEDRQRMPAQETDIAPQRRFSSRLKLRVEAVKLEKQEQSNQDKAQEPQERVEHKAQEPQERVEQWDVLAGLRNYAAEHVVLIGKPGSGKSTSLERLLWEEAEKALQDPKARIPVLVKLRRCTVTIEALIRDFLLGHQVALELVQIEELLRQGRFLLLLDGLNELPKDFETEAANFRYRYRRTTPMIVSTRDLGGGGTLGIEKTLKMLPLTEPQMREFVRGYLGEEGDQMFQQLQGDRLRKFAETPLLLWMLCWVFDHNGKVPDNLGLAFREFTQLYDQDIPGNDLADSKDKWLKPLRYLAFVMMQGKTAIDPELSIPREEAEDYLTAYLRQEDRANPRECAEQWLKDLLKYHLIQPVIQPNFEEHIEFRHQLIQEYYAAEYLLKLLPTLTDNQLKQEYLNYLKWTESVALMLVLVDSEAQSVWVVQQALEVDLSLGARLAGEVKHKFQQRAVELLGSWMDEANLPEAWKVNLLWKTRSSFAIPILNKLSIFLGHSGDVMAPVTISLMIDRLEYGNENGTEAKISALRDQAEDSNYSLRLMAAYELGRSGSEMAIPILLKLVKDSDSQVRRGAVEALGRLGLETAVSSLLGLLEDSDSQVRKLAVEVLGNIRSETAIPRLLKLLENSDSEIRRDVRSLICLTCSEVAIPGLLKLVTHSNPDVGRIAKSLLINLCSESTIPNLLSLLSDDPSAWSDISKNAAAALSNFGSEASIPSLLKLLENSGWRARESAVMALSDLHFEAVFPALAQLLEHSNSNVREDAAKVLGNLGSEAAIPSLLPSLLKLLENSDSVVRSSAAKALGKIGSERAFPALLKLLEDSDSTVRSSAAKALGNLGSKAAIPALLKLLEDSNSIVRGSAAETLGNLGSKAAIPDLLKLLKDSDSRVLIALSDLGSKAAIPGLLELVRDPKSHFFHHEALLYKRAVLALGNLGTEVVTTELLKLLEEPSLWHGYRVGDSVIEALVKIGFEKAIPALLKLVEDSDRFVSHSIKQSVSQSVEIALGNIQSEAAIADLLKLVEHSNSSARRGAAAALGKISETYPEMLAQQLPHLFTLIPTDSCNEAWDLIAAIQANCQFYNYEIFQAHLAAQKTDRPAQPNRDPNAITIQTLERLTIMTDKAPIFNQQHATIGVNYAAEGSKVEFTQHTNSSGQTFEILLTDYQQFIEQLQQKYPTVADPATVPQIIEVEAKLIEAQDHPRWQNFLNLKRLWNGSKKAGIKVGEHFAENNVWAKGAIAFLEGVSEDGK